MLEIFDMEQGTDEWLAVRLGLPTASQFSAILASGRGGGPSKTRLTYLRKLAGERITEQPTENFQSGSMARGKAMEAEARSFYAFTTDAEVRRVGFGKNHGGGASPDSLVGDVGMLEIKTQAPHLLIGTIEDGRVPSEHIAQIQGNLWVFEREWMDVLIYFSGMPEFRARVPRDDRYIDGTLAPAVRRFIDDLEELVERMGGGNIPAPAPPTPAVDLSTAPPAF